MKMVAKGKIVAYAVWHTDGQRELNFVEPGEFQPDGTTSAMKAAWLLNENASKLNLSLKRVHIREKRYIFLAPLLTAREHRGKKFGKALLEDGCEYARKRHLKCYFMSLPGAKDFYLKHGFEILGSREEVIGGEDRLESVDRPRPLVNTLMRMKSLG
ncbi:hypothetical protein BKA65DRAFT_597534 [Rhexocercosporidium sp. MPI-PUGE-AT-0058]|nr:hypothetical protein BKA65DRAFT_597534 [Rhexocercosporidium sp. MPI-PUGE-AT-0058]